jgi:hypothetical protein
MLKELKLREATELKGVRYELIDDAELKKFLGPIQLVVS